MTISDIASLIVALATTGSLLYISRQVNVTRQQTKGQFLLALDEQFDKFPDVTIKLLSEETFVPTGSALTDIFKLMSVFERINIMVEDGILDAGLVDRLYGFRLLSIIANDTIYQRVQASGEEWQDFIDLCYAVANRRNHQNAADRDKAFVERVHSLSKKSQELSNPWRL